MLICYALNFVQIAKLHIVQAASSEHKFFFSPAGIRELNEPESFISSIQYAKLENKKKKLQASLMMHTPREERREERVRK